MTCVNRPEWRQFQMASHAAMMLAHPYVAGFMFMHERSGPMQQLISPDPWQGQFTPGCFCEHCCALAVTRGIDPRRAREGMMRLVGLLRDRNPIARRDGVFVGFWRVLCQFPEILAWEQFQWESLHSYRADVASAMRMALPGISVGYHFQHCSLVANLPWRAGDDPAAVVKYADWVKPSVYPGVSGQRYEAALRRATETWLGDFTEETAHLAISAWFGRDPANGRASLGRLPDAKVAPQSAFGPDWVETETRRITEACAPLPNYAGLGIGVPGGEQADTVGLITECTKACYRGGAAGILLSRHHSEMRPELLKAAGDVIRRAIGRQSP
jgi:hypothetical protein